MRNLLYVLALLVLPVTCLSQEVASPIPARQHPYYSSNVMPALIELVRARGKSATNHFYVGRVDMFENGYHSLLIYWKENRALVLWEPGRGFSPTGESDPRYDLRETRRYWNLKKDVVPTLSDVGGSSFLLTSSDAREMVDDCILRGERYVVHLKAQSNKRLQLTAR